MKMPRLLAAGLILAMACAVPSVRAEGWSIWHPFSSGTDDSANKPKTPAQISERLTKRPPPPSTLDKIGAGTKNFFSGIGNAVSPSKPAPPAQTKTMYSFGTPQTPAAPAKKSSSWWNPFAKNEKKP